MICVNIYLPTNKNLSRSVLISGPSGSGKTFLTKAFAQTILNVSGSGSSEVLTLDRPTPNLSGVSGNAKIIANDANIEFPTSVSGCLPQIPEPTAAHDPWTLTTVWSKKPIGFSTGDNNPNVFTGSLNISTKEFLGYNSDGGQLFTNATGGTAAGNTTTTYFTVTAGGRAGRVHYETLVAMGSLGAQTAAYGTAATTADASDDTILPDA